MMNDTYEIRKQILKSYLSLHDGPEGVEDCVDLIKQMTSTTKTSPLPLVEMITVLKREKPKLAFLMRKRYQLQRNISMLFGLDFDYESARRTFYLEEESL